MPIKSSTAYAVEVAAMGFDAIKKDQQLFNAVSKALQKAQNKDQFNFLNDRNRDPIHLYTTYVRNNDVNIAAALQKAAGTLCGTTPPDLAKLAVVMKAITLEVKKLFTQNLAPCLKNDVSFKTWVDMANLPEIKKQAERNAKVASKKLGIADVAGLAKALQAVMQGNKAEALSALEKIAKEEKLKDKAAVILASLEKSGLI